MSKRISLDDVLKSLRSQAEADWSSLENTENVIGGKAVEPSQAGCHQTTPSQMQD